MEAGKRILHQFLEGSDKRFVIPVYQRNYDWRRENCKRLLDDLVRVTRENAPSHFFGGIVYFKPNTAGTVEHQIIDGQQRLTTITLFLLALVRLIEDGKMTVSDGSLVNRLNDYLVDKYAPENAKVKLKPINEDDEAYRRLFSPSEEPIANSKVTENYQCFLEEIPQTGLTADELYNAFKRLEFVDISVEKKDKPQLIFESINSTGVSLTEGDKIRNYVLMDLESRVQEQYFRNYWKPTEGFVCRGRDEDSVGLFVRDFLSMERGAIPNLNRVYVEFKVYAGEVGNRELLLQRLLDAARAYHLIISPKDASDVALAAALADLHRLDCQPAYPFLLRVLLMLLRSELTISQAVEILRYVESYVLRRLICDLPTNALNKVFADLHRSAAAVPETYAYGERVAYALRMRSNAARFPSDEEFRLGLRTKHVYEMRAKSRAYFLSRLENGTSLSAPVCGVENAVYSKILCGVLTVEHVMPQTLTKAWQEELGEDFARIHGEWLHCLGNLTLTAYNSEMSNKSFASKSGRTLEDLRNDNFGFASEGKHTFLNAFIAEQEHWTESAMQERTRKLAERALQIWKFPQTTYRPPEPPTFSYGLRQHKPNFFTGAKPIAVEFKGDRYPVDSWVTLARQVMGLLVKEDVEKLRASAAASTSKLFARVPNEWTEEVVPDVNAVFTGSTWDRCRMLSLAFSAFGDLDVQLIFEEEILDEESDAEPVDIAVR